MQSEGRLAVAVPGERGHSSFQIPRLRQHDLFPKAHGMAWKGKRERSLSQVWHARLRKRRLSLHCGSGFRILRERF